MLKEDGIYSAESKSEIVELSFPPQVDAAVAEWARLESEKEAVAREIKVRVAAFHEKLKQKMGVKELETRLSNAYIEAENQRRAALERLCHEAYVGKYGKGELALGRNRLAKGVDTLIRVVPFCLGDDTNKKRIALEEDFLSIKESGKVDMGAILRPGELTKHSGDAVDFMLRQFQFAEVSSDMTTKVDLDNLFNKLKKTHELAVVLRAFPLDYKPELKVGDVFSLGSTTHHSGTIDGRLVVLPTGRLAVLSEYSGDSGTRRRLEGITSDPRIESHWSAKGESCWCGSKLEEPTLQELDYLKTGQAKEGGSAVNLAGFLSGGHGTSDELD